MLDMLKRNAIVLVVVELSVEIIIKSHRLVYQIWKVNMNMNNLSPFIIESFIYLKGRIRRFTSLETTYTKTLIKINQDK